MQRNGNELVSIWKSRILFVTFWEMRSRECCVELGPEHIFLQFFNTTIPEFKTTNSLEAGKKIQLFQGGFSCVFGGIIH